jgi:hypothetical protein
MIGRRHFPLLSEAAFAGVCVSPRKVYVDGDKPRLIDDFNRKTSTRMIEGVGELERGVADLYRTARPDGVFCYTFFKAFALAPHQDA